MAKLLNPEPESITLNTELESPTLEPATEQVQPLPESTSNPVTAIAVEEHALDADAPTEPQVEAAPLAEAEAAQKEATAETVSAPAAPRRPARSKPASRREASPARPEMRDRVERDGARRATPEDTGSDGR